MSISAIRHLITPWNEQTLLQGSTDVAADVKSAKNLELIEELSAGLNGLSFDRVLVSPMQRAQQTARALGYTNFESTALVTEMSFGSYEGHPKAEMLRDLGKGWIEDPKSTVLGPELQKLEARIQSLMSTYASTERWLIISHGAFIRALWSYTNHGSIDRMNQIEVKNGELVNLNP